MVALSSLLAYVIGLAADFCQPVYEIFLSEAVANGRLKAPGFFRDPMIRRAYCKAQWNGPSQGMLDPLKEVAAAEKRIAIGISTRQRETIEMTGGDFESNVAQLARENQLMKSAGLTAAEESREEKQEEREDNKDEGKEDHDKEPAGGKKAAEK